MPIEVEGPDGNTYEFPDDMPRDAIRTVMRKRFQPAAAKQPESWMKYAEGLVRSPAQGITSGLGEEIAAGAGSAGNWLARKLGMDIPERSYSDILKEVRGEDAAFREAHPVVSTVGEIGGAVALPLGALNALRAPTLAGRVARTAAAGGVLGGVSGFGNAEGGTVNRLEGAAKGAAVGAISAPIIAHVVAPAAGALVRAGGATARYARNALASARDPQGAAIDNVADRLVSAGIDPAAIRAQVTPPASANLKSRVTEEQLATIISKSLNGETAKAIGKEFGIAPATVTKYVSAYREANPTPRNIIDISKELAGDGGAAPITRLGRAAYSLAGDESGEAAQRLIGRQDTQAGRTSNIIQRSVAGGDFEATRAAGLQNMEREAGQAYRQFYAEPDLAINQLDDLMADPLFRRANIQAQRQARVEAIRRNQGAARNGRATEPVPNVDPNNEVFSPQMLDLIQRQLRIASEGAVSNPNNARHARNLREVFLDRIEDHYPTFRDIRRNYATAQGQFGEEGALEAGAALTTRLGAPAREALRGFDDMTPAQQELFRLGFARKLMDNTANPQIGGAVANQFNTPAVREIVERLYPRNDRNLFEQGQRLLRDLQREAATTRTKNDVMVGARTAELGSDMSRAMETAQTAAHVVTGRWGKLLENLSTRLSTQLGRQGAREVLDVLTQTDPAQLLPTLNRLARSAQTANERRAYMDLVRQVRNDRTRRLIAPSAELPARMLAPTEPVAQPNSRRATP